MNLINYLNEKNIIQGRVDPPYSFEIIEQISFAVVNLIQVLNCKHLMDGGEFLIKYKFLSPLGYDIYIQFMELNLKSINEHDIKHKNDYDNLRQLLNTNEFDRIETACKEYLLYDHRDAWAWSYYIYTQANRQNYVAAAQATELLFMIDGCMAFIPDIIEYYFLAKEYESLLIAHKIYTAQYGERYNNAFGNSKEKVDEALNMVEKAMQKIADKSKVHKTEFNGQEIVVRAISDFFIDEVQPEYTVRIKSDCGICEAQINVIDCDGDRYRLELNFNGQKYLSNTTTKMDENFEFTLIDLQKKLPHDVKIMCCVSCKYGNFCPFGGEKIFCFKSFDTSKIKNKHDVCVYFSEISKNNDIDKWYEMEHDVINYCDDYEEINDNTYTYNDWLHWLKKDVK